MLSGARFKLCGLMAFMALCSCTKETRLHRGDRISFGSFELTVTSFDSYSREHQGVPWEVEIRLDCKGGNRFERIDFAESLSRRGRIYFYNAEGWRERVWLFRKGDDAQEFYIRANPPKDSRQMYLEFRQFTGGGQVEKTIVDIVTRG